MLAAGYSGLRAAASVNLRRFVAVHTSSVGRALSLSRKLRRRFALLLTLQAILLGVRWHAGDMHGSLLMLSVLCIGLLAVTARIGEVDGIYCGYFALIGLVSGLLDLNLAFEKLLWIEWAHWRKDGVHTHDVARLMWPGFFTICAASQLASAFTAYLLYKEAETFDDEEEPFFATAEQARIYNSALQHTERPSRSARSEGPVKAFAGTAHKLLP
ncbi:unnamed protein product [Symbiodinium microadriaticum]|nr:unnamed protein product [Symbiodinium microadriaticum]CAE7883042.1 unnamed protein product [Symbiodinium sp. KB8]